MTGLAGVATKRVRVLPRHGPAPGHRRRNPKELSTMTAEILAATEHLVLRRMTNDDAAALAAY